MSDGAGCGDVCREREWHAGPGLPRKTLARTDTQLPRTRVYTDLRCPWGWVGDRAVCTASAERGQAGAESPGFGLSPARAS